MSDHLLLSKCMLLLLLLLLLLFPASNPLIPRPIAPPPLTPLNEPPEPPVSVCKWGCKFDKILSLTVPPNDPP